MNARFEPITGRYLHLDLLDRPHRHYVEEARVGVPLLCLHAAGSDSRQFRGQMNVSCHIKLPRHRCSIGGRIVLHLAHECPAHSAAEYRPMGFNKRKMAPISGRRRGLAVPGHVESDDAEA